MLQLLTTPLAATLLVATPAPPLPVAVEASATPPSPAVALMRSPELWLGETRTLDVQFCREVEDWNPFLTRFDAEAYRCVEAWDDQQLLWLEEEYDAPRLRFFARRGTVTDAIFGGARPHGRYQVDLVVREMHAGQAWVEVTSARWTEEQTPEGTILHVIRALDMIEREGWALASSELERALRPNLPAHVRTELESIKETVDETRAALRGD
ncbi:MAG: hypothetical protein AAGA20_07930 [Planctomycetota bacterium]